jgi:phage gp46-like protein
LKIEAAAKSDLAWFVTEGAASSVEVVASIPTVNRVDIAVTITADERESVIKFSANWKVQ